MTTLTREKIKALREAARVANSDTDYIPPVLMRCDPATILSLCDMAEASLRSQSPEVKPLHWTESWVFGKRKWRGTGVFGEFAAFGDEYLTPNEVAAKKAAIEEQYVAAILSALTSSGNADAALSKAQEDGE